jgi:hypothetical protein
VRLGAPMTLQFVAAALGRPHQRPDAFICIAVNGRRHSTVAAIRTGVPIGESKRPGGAGVIKPATRRPYQAAFATRDAPLIACM